MGNLASATYNQTETIYKVPDAVGNLYRTPDRKGYTYSEGGRLLECPDWKYVYDLEGRLIEKISKKQQLKRFSLIVEEDEKPATLRWFYSWNANGSLKSVANNDRVHFAFEYDALGRRTAKINLSSKRIKRFLWDGNVPLHEWEYDLSERPNLSRDKDNLLVYDKEEPVTDNLITWVFDENSFVPAAKLVGDKSYSILTDHLGTPYEAYDENGEKVWARELDIYGNAIAGDSSFIPFLYQGQYYDEEIGLAYNRFRYYSPESGTYISQDPIGLAGNNPNFYGYTFDCNTEVDVWGLDIYILVADSDGYYPDLQYGKPTTQYVYLRKGQIYKIGESKNAKKRYKKSNLSKGRVSKHKVYAFDVNGNPIGLKMKIIVKGGSKKANQKTERKMLKRYYKKNGKLPAGNTCFH